MSTQATEAISLPQRSSKTVFPVLWAVSLCHLLNDMTQALLPAVYPILRGNLDLSFAQVGFLTFVYQITASLLQPFIGLLHRPPANAVFAAVRDGLVNGLLTIAFAPSYAMLLGRLPCCSGLVPQSSIRNLARRSPCFRRSHGLAQSLFQVGGNFGSALGPLAAAFIVLPGCRSGLAWFALARSRRHHHPHGPRPIGISKTGMRSVSRTQRPSATPRSLAGTCQRRCRS